MIHQPGEIDLFGMSPGIVSLQIEVYIAILALVIFCNGNKS
jgi:hypothetical protein